MLVGSQECKSTVAHPTAQNSGLTAASSSSRNELEDEDYDLYYFMPSRGPGNLTFIHSYGERRNAFDSSVRTGFLLARP
jgi:hypothetical protein